MWRTNAIDNMLQQLRAIGFDDSAPDDQGQTARDCLVVWRRGLQEADTAKVALVLVYWSLLRCGQPRQQDALAVAETSQRLSQLASHNGLTQSMRETLLQAERNVHEFEVSSGGSTNKSSYVCGVV